MSCWGGDFFCPPISTLGRRKQLSNFGGVGGKVIQGLNLIFCLPTVARSLSCLAGRPKLLKTQDRPHYKTACCDLAVIEFICLDCLSTGDVCDLHTYYYIHMTYIHFQTANYKFVVSFWRGGEGWRGHLLPTGMQACLFC